MASTPYATRPQACSSSTSRSPKRLQTVMGHSSVRMTFDLYGHLFDDIEKDRADMATIEAAIRAA